MDINIPLIITDVDLNKIISKSVNDMLNIDDPEIESLDTEGNKLSNVFIIDGDYFLKIVTRRHVEYHRLLTVFWNTSLLYTRSNNFFKSFDSPYEMVQFEYELTNKMINANVNTPKPINYGNYNDCGVIILEYIPAAIQFGDIEGDLRYEMAHKVYEMVSKLYAQGIPHGDLQQDNILISDGELYIIDSNNIDTRYIESHYYDIASVILTVSSVIEPEMSVQIAQEYFSKQDIKESSKFIDILTVQFGHDANRTKIKSKINAL